MTVLIVTNQFRYKFFSATLLAVLFLSVANSQSTRMVFDQFHVDGNTSLINCAIQDVDGFIWLGRIQGLYRYDGRTYQFYSSDPDDSTSITEGRPKVLVNGKDRDIWVGTLGGGVSRFDLDKGHFTSYKNSISNKSSLAGNWVGGIYVENDSIVWVGTDNHCLNRLNWQTSTVQRFYAPIITEKILQFDVLGDIEADAVHDSILYVGTHGGLLRFNKKKGSFTGSFRFPTYSTLYKPHMISIHCTADGKIWSGGTQGLICIIPDSNEILTYRFKKRPAYDYGQYQIILEIEEFGDENLLIQTHSDGSQLFELSERRFHRINNDVNLGSGSDFALVDSQNHLWIQDAGVLSRGRPPNRDVENISFRHIPGLNWSRSFLRTSEKNRVWIGTLRGSGLIEVDFDTHKAVHYPFFDEEEINLSQAFMRDLSLYVKHEENNLDSSIYIASSKGLLEFSLRNKIYREVVTEIKNLFAVYATDSLVFYSGEHELFSYNPDVGNTTLIIPEIARINDICEYDDDLLLATNNGFCKYSTSRDSLNYLIPDVECTQFVWSGDTIWVGAFGQGLFYYDVNSKKIGKVINRKGGPNNTIYALTVDNEGLVWLNSDGGTWSFNPKNGEQVDFREFGLGKRSPISQLPNGRFILGGHRAVSMFEKEQLFPRVAPPIVYISHINIANRTENVEFDRDSILAVELKPNEKEISIHFGAINYNPVSNSDFEYRLLGQSEDWIGLNERNFVTFHHLEPGQYTFELRATNAYGGRSEENRTIQITVLPSFIEQGVVQFFMGLFLLIVVLATTKYVKQRRRKKLFDRTVTYFANSRYAENSVDEILWDLARNVISRLNLEDCVVYLYDDDKKALVQKAAYGIKNPEGREILNPLDIPIGEGVVGKAAEEKRSIIVSDVSKFDGYIEDVAMNGSELSVPILHQNSLIGVIDSEHSKKGFFAKEYSDVVERIAKECAHKIVSAQDAEEIDRQERNLIAIQKEIAESKLTALQAQMNPHFVFNSLNSINWYILKNKPAEASLYLTKFSKLVRRILDNSKKLSIPLIDELETLRLYLDLESMRFDQTFDYQIETDDSIDLEEAMVPPLILQPFVENAIWHGLMPKEEKGKLLIQIFHRDGQLNCVVQDDGIGRAESMRRRTNKNTFHESKGLKLTTDRIQLLHKDYLKENTVKIIDIVDHSGFAKGTRVEVVLPYEE